jgi:hypothetical protein
MKTHNKIGAILSTIASIISFIVSLIETFSINSDIAYSSDGYFLCLFTLLSLIFSVAMYHSKSNTPLVLNIVCILITGALSIFVGALWILIACIMTLIGCVLYQTKRLV